MSGQLNPQHPLATLHPSRRIRAASSSLTQIWKSLLTDRGTLTQSAAALQMLITFSTGTPEHTFSKPRTLFGTLQRLLSPHR